MLRPNSLRLNSRLCGNWIEWRSSYGKKARRWWLLKFIAHSATCANTELRPKVNWNNRYHTGFWGHTHHITYIVWQSMTRFGVGLLPFDDLRITSWCVSVHGVFNVSGYRCVCVAWAGRVLYSWGILRLMRGPRASFNLLEFLSSSLWYSFWSGPIRALFFLRASSHLHDKNTKRQRRHSRLWVVFISYTAVSIWVTPCHHLLVKSLKQRRSLLWWRNSFGSSGMSERKTCATSRGPCEGEKPWFICYRNVCCYVKQLARTYKPISKGG